MALELVGRLSDAGLNFVFKGGTSLVLLLNPVRRLSIDVDIVTPEPLERLTAVLEQVGRTPPFIRYEHQTGRDRDAPPTKHFKIVFRSTVGAQAQAESHVQLDVIAATHAYSATERRRVETPFIRLESESHVLLPTVDCLLGDKLAAFAPTTIGVLYNPVTRHGQPSEPPAQKIMKQLFDVGHLFAEATDFARIDATYRATFEAQIRYGRGPFSIDQCLDDTIEAARTLSLIPSAVAAPHTEAQKILRTGSRGLTSHLLTESFTLDRHAPVAAARAALLAKLIRYGLSNSVPRDIVRSLPSPAVLGLITLADGPNAALTPVLRRTAPEALYLWSLIDEADALARQSNS